MARTKLATTVYLTEQQYDALRALTRETGIPTAHVIRTAIDAELQRRSRARNWTARGSETT